MTDTEHTETEAAEVTEAGDVAESAIQRNDTAGQDAEDAEDAETFPRDYVEKLRAESAKHRVRAREADALAERLHTELVRATGRLADPTDLPFDADHLDHPDALAAAVDELLAAKPHLASRRPTGDVGQGPRGGTGEPFSLLGTLKALT